MFSRRCVFERLCWCGCDECETRRRVNEDVYERGSRARRRSFDGFVIPKDLVRVFERVSPHFWGYGMFLYFLQVRVRVETTPPSAVCVFFRDYVYAHGVERVDGIIVGIIIVVGITMVSIINMDWQWNVIATNKRRFLPIMRSTSGHLRETQVRHMSRRCKRIRRHRRRRYGQNALL